MKKPRRESFLGEGVEGFSGQGFNALFFAGR